MGRPGYCWRGAVKAALDSDLTARDDAAVDRAIQAACPTIDSLVRWSHFDPRVDVRYFDWPDGNRSRSWRLWLDQHGLISLTSITAGGDTIPTGNVNLEPVNDGPPFDRVETDLGTSSTFTTGNTHQQAIAITGLWGHSDVSTPAGALAEALDSSETDVDVTNGALVDVWMLLRCEDERMIVTDRAMLDSGQNLGTNLTDSSAAQTVDLTSGAAFNIGEEILIGAERMLITEITGNNGTVERAYNGSTLAAHTSTTDIYVSRRLTVERGANGTTAAAHNTATALTRWVPPGDIEALALAEAEVQVAQELAQYGRTVGQGEAAREMRGAGIEDARNRAIANHKRWRIGAI